MHQNDKNVNKIPFEGVPTRTLQCRLQSPSTLARLISVSLIPPPRWDQWLAITMTHDSWHEGAGNIWPLAILPEPNFPLIPLELVDQDQGHWPLQVIDIDSWQTMISLPDDLALDRREQHELQPWLDKQPASNTDKPELCRHERSGWFSRKIDQVDLHETILIEPASTY